MCFDNILAKETLWSNDVQGGILSLLKTNSAERETLAEISGFRKESPSGGGSLWSVAPNPRTYIYIYMLSWIGQSTQVPGA
jgi:hypothetical protein